MRNFKKVYIEITNVCNLKCSFCSPVKRKAAFLSPEKFGHILDEIKPYANYIYLHVKGEPLLHPQFEELLKIANEKKFNVNITTNGTLISERENVLLGSYAPRLINFSLHSFDSDIDYIDTNNYIETILNFAEKVLIEDKTYISLRLWNIKPENFKETKQLGNSAILKRIEEKFNLDFNIIDELLTNKNVKIKNKIYLNSDEEFKWPEITDEVTQPDGFCFGLRNQIAILVDGTVVPCCLDSEGVINLGNIHETSFKDILESKRVTDIYEGFSAHKAVEELCQKCTFKSRFS